MLKSSVHRGFTIVELLIGIAVLALLLAYGAPSFSTWVQNTQIRTAADSIQNGLQVAKAAAVSRNVPVRFQFTSTLDNSCALSTTSSNWVVSRDAATGSCASSASDTTSPRIIQSRPAADGSRNAVVASSDNTVVFNGLGRVTTPASAIVTINVSNTTGGACVSASGPMRCLRIVVSPAGQIRMCDAQFTGSSTEGGGC